MDDMGEIFDTSDIMYRYPDDARDVINVLPNHYDIFDMIQHVTDIKSSNDPFYIVEINKVISQHELWAKELPDIRPYYAVKCNPDPIIIKTLSKLGCGFDCASKEEISLVLSLVDDATIIYANPCKDPAHIQYARSRDVDMMTFDTESELKKIVLGNPNAKMILRMKVDDSTSTCKFSSKFGCDEMDIRKILNLAKILEIDVIGVSFHVGSGCVDPKLYKKALQVCKEVFDVAKTEFGVDMNIIDIGGGYPGIDGSVSFVEIAEVIRVSIDEIFGDNKDIKFIAEPGRFFTTSSHTLVTNIIGIKKTVKDGEKSFSYTINDGIYGGYNCTIFDHQKPNIMSFNERNEKLYKSIVFGPTCDSMDTITTDAMLPELAIGDWVFTDNFGAYTRASSTAFNGFVTNKIFYVLRAKK